MMPNIFIIIFNNLINYFIFFFEKISILKLMIYEFHSTPQSGPANRVFVQQGLNHPLLLQVFAQLNSTLD